MGCLNYQGKVVRFTVFVQIHISLVSWKLLLGWRSDFCTLYVFMCVNFNYFKHLFALCFLLCAWLLVWDHAFSVYGKRSWWKVSPLVGFPAKYCNWKSCEISFMLEKSPCHSWCHCKIQVILDFIKSSISSFSLIGYLIYILSLKHCNVAKVMIWFLSWRMMLWKSFI